jgi:DNA topoisomerase VI subunit B
LTKLERTTFEASRAAEYFDARQLSALTGVPREDFLSVCLKELAHNALDACETAEPRLAPEVSVEVEYQEGGLCRPAVSDNGPGMPSGLVGRILDYNVRVSDKMAYRSPTRGAQGNALKTIVGIPYALGSSEPPVITAHARELRALEHRYAHELLGDDERQRLRDRLVRLRRRLLREGEGR